MELDLPYRPYQAPAKDKLVQLKRAPLIAPMGSGKSLIALGALAESVADMFAQPKPIVCPLNAVATWIREIQKWLGLPEEAIIVALGTKDQRERAWKRAFNEKIPFIISSYTSFVNDADFIPKHLPNVILDEPHRVMRSRTATWKHLCQWFLHSETLYLITGTPMRKGPEDFWPFLHMCNRKRFRGYWDYVNTWCLVHEGYFGKEICGPKNEDNFIKYIWGQHAAYVSDEEADKYLPEKQRILLPLEPTKKQRRLIEQIEGQIVQTPSGIILVPNTMSGILRERQILCTPKILDPSWEYGAGIDLIQDKLEDTAKDRPVIFTPFVAGLPHIKERLEKACTKDQKVHVLKGGTHYKELQDTVKAFTESSNDRMLCTVSFAESFELPTSTEAFMLGADWSPDVNKQAEDRLRRLTNDSPKLTYYYLRHNRTVDGSVLERNNTKNRWVSRATPKSMQQLVDAVMEPVD